MNSTGSEYLPRLLDFFAYANINSGKFFQMFKKKFIIK